MRFSKFWNTFPQVSTLTAWISSRIASLSCSRVRGVFLYTFPFDRPQRKKSAGVRSLPLVSNFLTNFWMQHFDGARLSRNSIRNAVWHALNEPVCQYLRTRNARFSTLYTDNSLGPLARDSLCIYIYIYISHKVLPVVSFPQNKASWFKRWRLCRVFRSWRVQIPAGTRGNPTYIFRGFTQPPQSNAGTVLQLSHENLLLSLLPLIIY